MKAFLSKIKAFLSSLPGRIKKNITSKDWWKQQYKIRKPIMLLYGFWVVYGAWLIMRPITYIVYDLEPTKSDMISASMIAFLWFFFYCINSISDQQMRKMIWKLVDIYKKHNDELRGALNRIVNEVEKAEAANKDK